MDPIETVRLTLDPLTERDLADLHALTGDATLMRYISGKANSLEETRSRLAKDVGYHNSFGFGLCLCRWRETGQVVGRAGLIPHPTDLGLEGELAWMLSEPWWGRGLATEVGSALIEFGRSLELSRIFAQAHPNNTASIRVMERLGMTAVPFDGVEVEYQVPGV